MLKSLILISWIVVFTVGCAPWHALPGPERQAPELRGDAIIAADGAVLPVRRWGPTGRPRAVVLALHGFNDYSKSFATLGDAFSRAGIVTYAYDQRGFGRGPHKGLWSSTEGMTDDLRISAKLIRTVYPGVPFYIIGESMGAAVILAAMNQESPPPLADGYILSAPAAWARRVMPWWQRFGLELIAHTVPMLHVTGRGFKRRPSDNIEMLRQLGRDPLVIKRTRVDTLYGLVGLMDVALDAVSHIRGNSLVLLGQQEDILPDEAVQALLSALPQNGCVRIAKYRSGYHMLFRDLKADVVLGDLISWMADPNATLPSGAELSFPKQEPGLDSQLGLHCSSRIVARP